MTVHEELQATADELEKLWKAIAASPAAPDMMYMSRSTYKQLRRYWRSKRKGHYKWVEITRLQCVELGIPAKSFKPYNEWWGSDRGQVDKRRLKRHKRKVRRYRK